MFIENETELENYILFQQVNYNIPQAVIYNNNLLYCQNLDDNCWIRQKSEGEKYLGSYKDKFNDNDHTIIYWSTDKRRCSFFTGLQELINNPSENFKFKMPHSSNLNESEKFVGIIYFYLHKDYYLQLFQLETIPLIMKQFLAIKNQNLNISDKLVVSPPINKSKYKFEKNLEVKLFKHQRDNISWMKSHSKELYINSEENLQITYIESTNEYILYNKNYKVFRFESIHKKKINGGLICDEVGLGKTLTCYGYINMTGKNLIIVPNRLVKQWLEEFYKYYGNTNHIIYGFSTVRSLSKLKDFTKGTIICPVNIFSSPNYLNQLEKVRFDRIFIDEAHEFLNYSCSKKKEVITYLNMLNLKSKEKWLLTATPYCAYKDNLKAYYKFFTGKDLPLLEKNYMNYIKSKIPYRYNTKESVKNEIKLPGICFETKMLKMSKIERALYNAAQGNIDKQIQLCTHFQITDDDSAILGENVMTIEEAKKKLLDRYEFRLKKNTKSLEKYLDKTDPESIILKQELTTKNHTLTSRINIIKSLDIKQECSICIDEIENPSITSCGHIFCTECLDLVFQGKQQYNCPMCRNLLTIKDIFEIGNEETNKNTESNQYGTKISYLMKLIKNNPDSRFILFSQWDKMFKMVGQIFDKNEISYVNLKGNMFHIANSIRKFKVDKKIKVIMLSSDKANSGCNLTAADHIIFLDNYYLTNDTMTQAIGRAHRIGQTKELKVTKLIMQNTIEDKPEVYVNL